MGAHSNKVTGIKGELVHFADSLRISDFRALTQGLGTGVAKKRFLSSDEIRVAPQGKAVNLTSEMPLREPVAAVKNSEQASKIQTASKPQTSSTAMPQMSKVAPGDLSLGSQVGVFLLRHFIDLTFSAIAIVSMLLIAGMATQSVGIMESLRLVRGWVGALRSIELVAALYGTFLLYAAVFHLFVGGTLGAQILARDVRNAKTAGQK
jgi:hypothetical protein